jgi:hypothetical protein
MISYYVVLYSLLCRSETFGGSFYVYLQGRNRESQFQCASGGIRFLRNFGTCQVIPRHIPDNHNSATRRQYKQKYQNMQELQII